MMAKLLKTVEATHKLVLGMAAELRELQGRRSGNALPALPVQSKEELDNLNRALAEEKAYDQMVIILYLLFLSSVLKTAFIYVGTDLIGHRVALVIMHNYSLFF